MKEIENPKPELNIQKLSALLHPEFAQAEKMEELSKECEAKGKDESIPASCRVSYMEKSLAFAGLAKEIYNICAPVNSPAL